jgi:hypothetical protein
VNPTKKFVVIMAVALPVVMTGTALALTAIFGPSDNGLVCTRSESQAGCEVRQSRFFGLAGNSSFVIPESAIRGAKSVCGTMKVGGHASPNCNVYLILDSGREYPVASYVLAGQAEASARKLNDYFADRSARRVELKEDLRTPVIRFVLVPALFVGALLTLRRWFGTRSQ